MGFPTHRLYRPIARISTKAKYRQRCKSAAECVHGHVMCRVESARSRCAFCLFSLLLYFYTRRTKGAVVTSPRSQSRKEMWLTGEKYDWLATWSRLEKAKWLTADLSQYDWRRRRYDDFSQHRRHFLHESSINYLKIIILSCTSPPNVIYANTKSAGTGHGGRAQRCIHYPTGPTVLAGDKERRPIWPDLAGRCKSTS